MADTKITTVLDLKTLNVKETIADTAKIHDNLEKASQAANKLSRSAPMRSAQAAGRATSAAITKASASDEELLSYGVARGAVGTGAAGRDFAKQAQGLGGLVHLYATFAANIFAVGAAFRALSSAMDTANMVKGLDQLGAASGRNLGTLAKKLVEATDMGVSLREAMEATAKATSAGLSSKQILEMGTVAKKASQALGLDMTDALSRVSRGISKLEPELLDELGIYVKIDDANQKYAASLNRTAASLSDFEKKQAFANAVISQGLDKFSSIQIDTNPYAKLLASSQNLLQTGLELVNKVLSPLVKFLAESPTGLSLALATIAGLLIKQAIPALGRFRENAKAAAEEARRLANERSIAATEAGVVGAQRAITAESKARFEAMKQQFAQEKILLDSQAQQKEELAEKAADRLKQIQKSVGKASAEILGKPAIEVTENELKKLQSQAARFSTQGREELAKRYSDAVTTIKEAQVADKAYHDQLAINSQKEIEQKKLIADAEATLQRTKASYWSVEAATQRDADAANKKAEVQRISAAAGEITRVKGVKAAWSELNQQIAIAKKGIISEEGIKIPEFGALTAGVTRVKGAFSIATAAIDIFATTLSRVFFWIGTGITAFNILSSFLSTNSKEAEEFSKALDLTRESGNSLSRTLEKISSSSISKGLNAEDIKAVNTGLIEAAQSLSNLVEQLNKIRATSSWFDNLTDSLFYIVGKTTEQKFAKEFGYTLFNAIKAIPEGPAKAEAEEKIKNILKISDISLKNLEAGLNRIPNAAKSAIGSSVTEVISNASKLASASTDRLVTFENSLNKATEAHKALMTSLIPSDPIFKFGSALITMGDAMTKAFEDPKTALIALTDVIKDPNKFKLFSPEQQALLLKLNSTLNTLSVGMKAYEVEIANSKKELEKLIATQKAWPVVPEKSTKAMGTKDYIAMDLSTTKRVMNTGKGVTDSSSKAIQEVANRLKIAQDRYNEIQKEIVKATGAFGDAGKKLVETGYKLTTIPIEIAKREAALTISKAVFSDISGVGAAQISAADRQQEINNRLANTQAVYSLTQAMLDSIITQKEAIASQKINTATIELASAKTPREIDNALEKLSKAREEYKPFEQIKDFKSGKVAYLDLSPESRTLLKEYVEASSTIKAERIKAGAESKASSIIEQKETKKEQQEVSARILQNELEAKNVELERLNLATSGLSVLNKELLDKKQILETDIENISNRKKLQDISNKIVNTVEIIAELEGKDLDENNKKRLAGAKENLKDLNAQYTETERLQNLRSDISSIKKQQEVLKNNAAIEQKNADVINDTKSTGIQLSIISLEYEKARLALLSNTGMVSKSYSTERQASLEAENLALSYQKDLLDINIQKDKEQRDLRLAREVALKGATDAQKTDINKQFAEEEENINSKYSNRLSLLNATTKAKEYSLTVTKNEALALAQIEDITGSLVNLFGDLGTAVSNLAKTFVNINTANKNFSKEEEARQLQIAALRQSIDETEDPKEQEASRKKISDLEKKSATERTKFELDSNAKILSSAKGLFKEKSTAYKTLSAIEKAMHIARLVAIVTETAANIASVGPTIAAETAKNSTKGVGAILSALNAPWPINFVAGATMAAIVASLLGGKGPSIQAGTTAEDQQKVQGTGQQYVGGVLTTREGGVLGDPKAIAKSINDSTETLSKVFFDHLGSGSSNIVRLLKGIKDNTYELAKTVVTGGSVLGSQPFGIIQGASRSFLGFSKESTTILDQGIKIVGTIGDILNGMGQAVEYANVLRESSSFWGLFSDSSLDQLKKQNTSIGNKIKDIFTNVFGILKQSAISLEGNADRITNILTSFDASITVSSKDKTATEFAEALMAEISVKLNAAAKLAFPYMEKYVKVGEEYYTTVARVIKESETLTDGFRMLDKQMLSTISKQDLIYKQQDYLIKNFEGNIDNFVTTTQYYFDNFVSASRKSTYYNKLYVEGLKELGINTKLTKDQFIALVDSLDVSIPAQADLEAGLKKLAPILNKVNEETNNLSSLFIDLAKASGEIEKSLALTRAKELESLSQSEQQIKLQIYALEDETNLRQKLTDAIDKQKAALNSSLTSFSNYIKNINNLKSSLLMGDISILTAQDKFNVAKEQFEELKQTALKPATSPTEIAARNAALDQLSQASNTYLTSARGLFASSEEYTAIFNSVISTLDDVGISLEASKTDVERQLEALSTQTSFLSNIDNSLSEIEKLSKTTNEYLNSYIEKFTVYSSENNKPVLLTQQQIFDQYTPILQSSISAQTIALEATIDRLVTGLMPTKTIMPVMDTVTTLEANNAILAQEIKNLNATVQGLREDNASQNQDLIKATAMITQMQTEALARAQEDAAKLAAWEASLANDAASGG